MPCPQVSSPFPPGNCLHHYSAKSSFGIPTARRISSIFVNSRSAAFGDTRKKLLMVKRLPQGKDAHQAVVGAE